MLAFGVFLLASAQRLPVATPSAQRAPSAAPSAQRRPVASPSAQPGPVASPSDFLTFAPPEPPWWEYLIDEHPEIGLLILVLLVSGVAFICVLIPLTRRRRRRNAPASKIRVLRPSPLDGFDSLYPDDITEPANVPDRPVVAKRVRDKPRPRAIAQQPTADTAWQPQQGNVFYPPSEKKWTGAEQAAPKSTVAGRLESAPSPAVVRPSVSEAQPDRPAWVDLLAPPSLQPEVASLRRDLDWLKKEMAALISSSQTHKASLPREQSLAALKELELQDQENARRLEVLEVGLGQVMSHLEEAIGEQLTASHNREQAQTDEIERIAANNLDLSAEIAELREMLEELSEGDRHTPESDSFYAKTLGAILGQNIDALRAGNFEQMSQEVGERLNQFFQLEVPYGDTLQSLCQRAAAINLALKDVAAEMARLKPETVAETAPHLRRAEALDAELGSLQAQLQNRRATVETTLRVPVSIHAGARQTFLNELGRGIRREVDKLSDPQSYFAGELNRLIAGDIVSVVDVCDTIIAHPGTRPELELALSQLFTHAGLRTILPRQGDPFRSAEHERVRAIAGATGKSMSIAQVTRRGFYHAQPDRETLLRRAGVVVYR